MHGRLIVFSAPSGAGKTSIVRGLMQRIPSLSFSVSATSRKRREGEQDGVDYYFMSPGEFRDHIDRGDFLEWEEVYPGSYYGTLRSEVDRIMAAGKHVVFDVDVAGGMTIKKTYKAQCLSLFIMPPSVEELKNRLLARRTESPESLHKRISKAEHEMSFSGRFDHIVVNDVLEDAIREAVDLVESFIQKTA